MPLIEPSIKSKLDQEIFNNLKEVFSPETSKGTEYSPIADEMLHKIAKAVSTAVAKVFVDEMTNNAQVVPGQQVVTAGSPSAQAGATVSPGKII